MDSTYAYDNLGRLTGAGNSEGMALRFGYDALGRKTSEGSDWYGTTRSQYDAGGRRTRLTWADGFFVTYDHLVTGETTAIRENGGLPLATFAYDEVGSIERKANLVQGMR